MYRVLELALASPDLKSSLGKPQLLEAKNHAMELLELAVRMITIILTKTPGAMDRLTERRPRCVELTGTDDSQSPAPAIPFTEFVGRIRKLVHSCRREEYVGQDEEGSTASRLRGNLALLVSALCQAQSAESDLPPALRQMDLGPFVDDFVGLLRKEKGKVQNNIGVCLTKLAQSPRYVQRVRDLNGIESLHQIQLPRAEKDRDKKMKLHRVQGPQELKDLD